MNGTDVKRLSVGSVLAWSLALIPLILPAQSIWVDRTEDRSVSVEILKPALKENMHPEPAQYAFFLSLRVPVADSVRLVVELPAATRGGQRYDYGYGSYQWTYYQKAETAFGNPYLGFEASTDRNVFWEMGLRLPLTSEKKSNARGVGILADFDRMEAFSIKLLPLQMSLNVARRDASGLVMRLRGGPDLWISTDSKTEGDKTEFWMHYSAQLGYEGELLNLLAGVTGRLWVTGEDLTLGERSFHQLGINAGVNLGRFRPGLHIRIPIDKDLSELIENVIGINCSIRVD